MNKIRGRQMTVGELKKVLNEAPDDLEIFYIYDGWDIPVGEAWIEKNEKTGKAEAVLMNTYL